jgi:hypothetical protein
VAEVGDLVVLRRVHAEGRAEQEREQPETNHGAELILISSYFFQL